MRVPFSKFVSYLFRCIFCLCFFKMVSTQINSLSLFYSCRNMQTSESNLNSRIIGDNEVTRGDGISNSSILDSSTSGCKKKNNKQMARLVLWKEAESKYNAAQLGTLRTQNDIARSILYLQEISQQQHPTISLFIAFLEHFRVFILFPPSKWHAFLMIILVLISSFILHSYILVIAAAYLFVYARVHWYTTLVRIASSPNINHKS